MNRWTRTYYTDSQKALTRSAEGPAGPSIEIGPLFDRPHTSIHNILSRTGGIRPATAPFSSGADFGRERGDLARAGDGRIGSLNRSTARKSTIDGESRELKRNGGRENYRANQADRGAWDRALRPELGKLVENRTLARVVADKLRLLWTPEQIAGWLKHTYPCDESQYVSHETIYRSLFIQARGALNAIARQLNQRPPKTLGFHTPAEMFNESVASIG